MNIYVIGTNYNVTPLEIREKLSFSPTQYPEILKEVKANLNDILECSVISTCNRTEFHIYTEYNIKDTTKLEEIWCRAKGIELANVKKYFYFYQENKAIKHIFKVASGMDSAIIGEEQVLGQFKNAYEIARDNGMTGTVLNTLARNAITASKKIKTNIYKKRKDNSISKLVIKKLLSIYNNDIKNKSVLVIGSGVIGTAILQELLDKDVKRLYTTKRNYSRGDNKKFKFTGVKIIDYEDRYSIINECEIVISATSSPHYTITWDELKRCIGTNVVKTFIDLAVPRDFDSEISKVRNINYYNIDNFTLHENELLKDGEINVFYIDELLNEWTKNYVKWFKYRELIPLIQGTKENVNKIIMNNINRAIDQSKSITEQDKQIIRDSTKIINTILNKIFYNIKDLDEERIEDYFNNLIKSISNIR